MTAITAIVGSKRNPPKLTAIHRNGQRNQIKNRFFFRSLRCHYIGHKSLNNDHCGGLRLLPITYQKLRPLRCHYIGHKSLNNDHCGGLRSVYVDWAYNILKIAVFAVIAMSLYKIVRLLRCHIDYWAFCAALRLRSRCCFYGRRSVYKDMKSVRAIACLVKLRFFA